MQITPDSFVTVDYLIRLPGGQSFPRRHAGTPLLLHGARHHASGPGGRPGGSEGGDSRTVHLTPEQAYGEVDEDLIVEIPKAEFDPNVELSPGTVFETEDEEGHPVYFILMEVKDDTVVVDFNHPWRARPWTSASPCGRCGRPPPPTGPPAPVRPAAPGVVLPEAPAPSGPHGASVGGSPGGPTIPGDEHGTTREFYGPGKISCPRPDSLDPWP